MTAPSDNSMSARQVIADAVVYQYRGLDGLGADLVEEEGPMIADVVLAALAEAGYDIKGPG